MSRNYRKRPNWIPATVTKVLGPVTYLVCTDDGLTWKRHANQLKEWNAPPCQSPAPTEDFMQELEEDDNIGDRPAPVVPVQQQEHVDDPHAPEVEAPPNVERRYPVRNRHPPERYA